MPSQTEMSQAVVGIIGRERLGGVIWSDVVPEIVRLDTDGNLEPDWWRHTDTDAVITSRLGNFGMIGMLEVPIGYVPWESIGLLQLDNRIQKANTGRAAIAIANRAPRNDANVLSGANGEPYRMAVTQSGMIVFASHLSALSDVATKITAIYEVPKNNSVYDEHEQFRSSVVAQMANHLDELVEVDKDTIPQIRDSVAYIDKFGNVIGRTTHMEMLIRTEIGKMIALQIENNGEEHEVPVRRGLDLRSAREGEITVYPNISDGYSGEGTGTYEIITRVNTDPSHSRETAIYRLQDWVEGLDIKGATVRLAA